MINIDSLFADDVKKKKEGVKIPVPGIEGAYLLICSYDQIAFNEAIKRKRYMMNDPENPTNEESRLVVAQVYVEEFIKGWGGIFENDKELEDTVSERLRVLGSEKYERLLNVAIAEMNNIANFKYEEKEKAKKH